MRVHQIITPDQVTIEYRIAEIPSRVLAATIDLLWQLVGLCGVLMLNLLILSYFESFYLDYWDWFMGVSLLLVFLIFFGYGVYFEFRGSGQTPGKSQLGIRTLRLNGEPLSLSHAAIRNLFKYLLDGMGIGIWWMLFDKRGRRLGDVVASTIVIYDKGL